MFLHTQKIKHSTPFRLIVGILIGAFLLVLPVNVTAQGASNQIFGLSSAYAPALIKGITINPQNPLQFDFLIDVGNEDFRGLQPKDKSDEYQKLIRYFLAALTVPEKDLWVNLSPYEKDRIIPDDFGKTDMGRDLLSQDYFLKQITASILHPEQDLGKKFWKEVYKKAQEKFGTTDIPVNTFNKVWIIPDKASVYEKDNTVLLVDSHLKVMLEEDYVAMQNDVSLRGAPAKNDAAIAELKNASALPQKNVNKIGSQVIREIILPAIEKEVNEGKNFAMLRQINNSLILATWYKTALKESLLGKIYVDRAKTDGVDQEDVKANQRIYEEYLEAFKKGAYNFIKEEVDPATQELIPRKYFSGGYTTMVAGSPLSKRIERLTAGAKKVGEFFRNLSSIERVSVNLAEASFANSRALSRRGFLGAAAAGSLTLLLPDLSNAAKITVDNTSKIVEVELGDTFENIIDKYYGTKDLLKILDPIQKAEILEAAFKMLKAENPQATLTGINDPLVPGEKIYFRETNDFLNFRIYMALSELVVKENVNLGGESISVYYVVPKNKKALALLLKGIGFNFGKQGIVVDISALKDNFFEIKNAMLNDDPAAAEQKAFLDNIFKGMSDADILRFLFNDILGHELAHQVISKTPNLRMNSPLSWVKKSLAKESGGLAREEIWAYLLHIGRSDIPELMTSTLKTFAMSSEDASVDHQVMVPAARIIIWHMLDALGYADFLVNRNIQAEREKRQSLGQDFPIGEQGWYQKSAIKAWKDHPEVQINLNTVETIDKFLASKTRAQLKQAAGQAFQTLSGRDVPQLPANLQPPQTVIDKTMSIVASSAAAVILPGQVLTNESLNLTESSSTPLESPDRRRALRAAAAGVGAMFLPDLGQAAEFSMNNVTRPVKIQSGDTFLILINQYYGEYGFLDQLDDSKRKAILASALEVLIKENPGERVPRDIGQPFDSSTRELRLQDTIHYIDFTIWRVFSTLVGQQVIEAQEKDHQLFYVLPKRRGVAFPKGSLARSFGKQGAIFNVREVAKLLKDFINGIKDERSKPDRPRFFYNVVDGMDEKQLDAFFVQMIIRHELAHLVLFVDSKIKMTFNHDWAKEALNLENEIFMEQELWAFLSEMAHTPFPQVSLRVLMHMADSQERKNHYWAGRIALWTILDQLNYADYLKDIEIKKEQKSRQRNLSVEEQNDIKTSVFVNWTKSPDFTNISKNEVLDQFLASKTSAELKLAAAQAFQTLSGQKSPRLPSDIQIPQEVLNGIISLAASSTINTNQIPEGTSFRDVPESELLFIHESNLAEARTLREQANKTMDEIDERFNGIDKQINSKALGEIPVDGRPETVTSEIAADLQKLDGFQKKMDASIKRALSSYLQYYLVVHDASQTEVAEAIGVSLSYFGTLVNNKTDSVPSLDLRRKIITTLALSDSGATDERIDPLSEIEQRTGRSLERGKKLFLRTLSLGLDAYDLEKSQLTVAEGKGSATNFSALLQGFHTYVSVEKIVEIAGRFQGLVAGKSQRPAVRSLLEEELLQIRRDLASALGKRLVELRKESELNWTQLSKQSGVSLPAISMFSRAMPGALSGKNIRALAKVLGEEVTNPLNNRIHELNQQYVDTEQAIAALKKASVANLEGVLKDKGMTQRDLARETKIDFHIISDWIVGKVVFNIQELPNLAQAFKDKNITPKSLWRSKEPDLQFFKFIDQESSKVLVASSASSVGGINLDPANLNLQIKRDGKGVPLPVNLQDVTTININGFVPVIINITPVLNLPLLLGINTDQKPEMLSRVPNPSGL